MHRLRNKYAGRMAAVLGGGPSLPDQIKEIPPGTILIGVNHHASKLVECDFIAFNDGITWDFVKDLPGRKISRFGQDLKFSAPKGQISGIAAVQAAFFMGCAPVLLAGFDCYRGGGYFHDPEAAQRERSLPIKDHLDFWRKGFPTKKSRADVIALGGPLTDIFNTANEESMKPKPAMMTIEVTKAKSITLDHERHVNFIPGEFCLRRELAEAAIDSGIATEVKPKPSENLKSKKEK